MNNSISKKWGGVSLTTIMFSAMSVFSQTQPNALPTTGNIGIGTATPACELDVKGATSIDGTLIVKDSVRLEKKLIVDQDTRIKGKTIIDGNLRAKSNLKVVGNSRVDGNARIIGNEVVDGNIKAKSNLRVLGNSITEGNNRIDGNTRIFGVTKMKGDAFVEGDFKFKQLADPTATADKWLTIDENGKVKSLDKAGMGTSVLADAYAISCKYGPNSPISAYWKSIPNLNYGILATGYECNSKVGIGTDNPLAKLDVRGATYFSGVSGVGIQPNSDVQLYVKAGTPSRVGLCVDMPNSNDYSYGIKLRTDNAKVKALAINAISDGEDVFRVMGNGNVWATEVHVRLKQNFPDYVFNDEYNLMSLDELDSFIVANSHLPGMPTASKVQAEGIDLGEMNRLLVEKIEELTLYVIKQDKELKKLETAIINLNK